MDDKKKFDSDTISQQRKAREEFLELKRMQSGEIAPPPPPSSEAKTPGMLSEKSENFWFYNRFKVISILFVAVVLAIGIIQCATRKNYDLKITLYTMTQFSDEQAQKIEEYFTPYCSDVNKDGQVLLSVLNCSYTEGGNRQFTQAMDTKVQSIIVAETEAMLFIVDEKTLERLNSIPSSTSLFGNDAVMLGDDFYSAIKTTGYVDLPEGLRIVRRNISNTTMQKDKNAAICYKAAGAFLEKLRK